MHLTDSPLAPEPLARDKISPPVTASARLFPARARFGQPQASTGGEKWNCGEHARGKVDPTHPGRENAQDPDAVPDA